MVSNIEKCLIICENEACVNCETHKCLYINLVSLLQTKPTKIYIHRNLDSTPLLIFHIKTSQTLKLQVVLAKWRIQQYMVVEIQKLLFFLTCYHAQPAMLNIRFLTIHHLLRLRIRVTSPSKFQDQIIFSINVGYCRVLNRNMFCYFSTSFFLFF